MWIWFLCFCMWSLAAVRIFFFIFGVLRFHHDIHNWVSFSFILCSICISQVSCVSLALGNFLLLLNLFPLSSLSTLFLELWLETIPQLLALTGILETLQLLASIVSLKGSLSFSLICFLSSRDSLTFLASRWQSFLFISTTLHLLLSCKTYFNVFSNDVRQWGWRCMFLICYFEPSLHIYFCLIVQCMIYVASRTLEN